MNFLDRQDAGRKLAAALKEYISASDAVVIALPRGGVVVGYEIASSLSLPLDIVCPRKIAAPFNPEFAIGAITETGEGVLSENLILELNISKDYIDREIEKEKKEAKRRLDRYREGKPQRNLEGKKVILVDDGLATGSTMLAAVKTLKAERVKKIILAIPVAPADTLLKFEKQVDQIICLSIPSSFYAIGQFYDFFDQISDEEVIQLLKKQIL